MISTSTPFFVPSVPTSCARPGAANTSGGDQAVERPGRVCPRRHVPKVKPHGGAARHPRARRSRRGWPRGTSTPCTPQNCGSSGHARKRCPAPATCGLADASTATGWGALHTTPDPAAARAVCSRAQSTAARTGPAAPVARGMARPGGRARGCTLDHCSQRLTLGRVEWRGSVCSRCVHTSRGAVRGGSAPSVAEVARAHLCTSRRDGRPSHSDTLRRHGLGGSQAVMG